MPLATSTFKANFKTLMEDMRTRDEVSDDEFANRLGDMLETLIKSGDGVYQTGTLQQSGATNVVAVTPTIVKIQ